MFSVLVSSGPKRKPTMSSIIPMFLLLAGVVCISEAQLNEAGQSCLCHSVRKGISSKSSIKDIQIYPPTVFCNKVEIVVSETGGLRYCLNPEMKKVKRIVTGIISERQKKSFRLTSSSAARI